MPCGLFCDPMWIGCAIEATRDFSDAQVCETLRPAESEFSPWPPSNQVQGLTTLGHTYQIKACCAHSSPMLLALYPATHT